MTRIPVNLLIIVNLHYTPSFTLLATHQRSPFILVFFGVIMAEQEKDDDERCPLCPISGPPTRSTIDADKSGLQATNDSENTPAEIEDSSLFWIACSKCSTWYHSCCLLLGDEGVRESVPQAVRDEVGKNTKGDGPFQDWTVWINRW